mmetsp:Transcript_10639/g.23496  ORF Transcript_10639/g.23496 Transcript_10639/m.23496 type:complete len:1242 (+) Transcript_10639:284-4009(+)
MPNLISWVSLLSLALVAEATPIFSVNRAQNMRQFRSSLSAMHRTSRKHQGVNTAFVSQPSSIQSANQVSTTSSIATTKTTSALDSKMQIFHGRFHSMVKTTSPSTTKKQFSLSSPLHVSLSTLETEKVDQNDPSQPINSITGELNPSQTEATLRPRYSITRVIAGPGAGKTRVLTCRIAHLLMDKSHLNDELSQREGREGILAVTFTKKASMEMERRLTDLIASATQEIESSSSSYDATPAISTGGEDLEEGEFVQYGNADPDDESNEGDANSIARQLMKRTTVGTFHSVCSKILRKFGKELGNLPSVRNCLGVTKASGATVFQEGTELSGNEEEPTNEILIQTLDGSFNIVDQSDQLRLLKDVLQKHNIQLKSPSASSGLDIRPITVLNAISLLNTAEAEKLTSPGGTGSEDDLPGKMSRKVYKIATEIWRSFQKAKYSQNSVDFDDLILLTRELLLYHPEVREVLHRRWRHILVDEFQDTSGIQLDLVRLLTTNSLFAVGDGDQSIYSWRGASPESMSDFEVAFHDRAHGWEGLLNNHDGNLSQYLERISGVNIHEEDAPLKVMSVYLMENYRSTTNIVKAAQRIISTSEKSDKDDPASTQDNLRRDMKPMRGAGPSPRVLACKDAKAEAKFVVKTVNSMVDSGDLTPSSTVAMIYRTNAQSRLLEEACVAHNLRYVVRGSSGTFYKRAEIQDCMSFLKIMYNDRDRSAWARAVKAPSRGIGETSLKEFFTYCDAVTEKYLETASNGDELPTPMDVMLSLAPTAGANPDDIGMLITPKEFMSTRSINRFIPFASSLRSLKRKAEVQAVPDFLLSVIEDLSLKTHFDAISKTRDEYEDRLGNVMELVGAAERYKEDGPCISPASENEPMEIPLGNFLDDVALIADLAPDESDIESDGRIVANLMTIHSSKGMEFDAVLLVGNEEGTFPSQRSIGEGEGSIELAEERRLCYVAMTRAKTHLVLTWRREVSYFAAKGFKYKDADRSRFLDILVSKQGAKPSKGGPKSSAQAGSSNISARRSALKSSGQLGSVTKRELHSEANRYLAAGNKSWDDWEPTSLMKPIGKIPVIKTNRPSGGTDRRQVKPSSETRNRPIQSSSDRRQVMPSSQNQRRPKEINLRRDQIASPQHSERSIDRRQIQPSHQTMTQNSRAIAKKPSETTRRTSTPRGNTLTSEAPPSDMDSTLFFPVGSGVKHKLHGKGVVQTPPNADAVFAEKMLVRVKFMEESLEWDLPMDGLMHTYE